MIRQADWHGRLAGKRPEVTSTRAIRLVGWLPRKASQGQSKPQLAMAEDGRDYWVKHTGNPQGSLVLVNEQIVGRCGAHIGAPTCEVALVEIPPTLAQYESGSHIEPGLAHGSLDIPTAAFSRELQHRHSDDNVSRHAGVLALMDWCWGADDQWLYDSDDDEKTYSHDHGYFLPYGPRWKHKRSEMETLVDQPSDSFQTLVANSHATDVSEVALLAYADNLDQLTAEQIADILCVIPTHWPPDDPVNDDDLEFLGYFLQRRASMTANRLRALAMTGGPL